MLCRSIIEGGQIRAKIENDNDRMVRTQFYLDYYNNIIRDYLREAVDQLISDNNSRAELKHYLESNYTCERIINQICLLFQEEPVIEGDNEKGEDDLNKLIEEINFFPLLDQIEKYVAVVKDVPVLPIITEGELKFIPVLGNMSFVEQKETDLTQFRRFYYNVGNITQTGQAKPINIYHFWQEEGDKWRKYECKVNDQRVILDEKLIPDAPVYPFCPVVTFRDYYPLYNYWSESNNAIVEKSFAIDLKMTDLSQAEAYHIAQMVLNGAEEKDKLKVGRNIIHKLNSADLGDQVKSLNYISPQDSLQEKYNLILDRITQLALSQGLSKSLITGETGTSGYQLMLSKHDILQANRKKRKYFRKSIKELLKIAQYSYKYILGNKFYESKDFNVDFGEYSIITSKEEQEKFYTMAIANNTMNLVDVELAKNPDIQDRQEAYKIVEERAKENKAIREQLYSNALMDTDAEI